MLSILFVTVPAFAVLAPASAPTVTQSPTVTEAEPTNSEFCSDYAFSEEKYGHFKNVELSLQRGACNIGSSHTGYEVTLVARDPKTKKIIATYADSGGGDGISLEAQKYRNGVFLFSNSGRVKVVRYDSPAKEFKIAWEFRDRTKEREPLHSPVLLSGTDYQKTRRKIADFIRLDCQDIHKLGTVLLTDASVYEEALLLSTHAQADASYKSGRKAEAAEQVLRFLGNIEIASYETLEDAMRTDAAAPDYERRSVKPELVRIEEKFEFSRAHRDGDESLSAEGSTQYLNIREWNDLAFYLMQAGYSEPAAQILERVKLADPERSVAVKNLRQARAMKKSKPVVFNPTKFMANETQNLRALKLFTDAGGEVVWTYDDLNLPKTVASHEQSLRSRHLQKCRGRVRSTLLDLALARGQTKVADFLWEHGFNSELIAPEASWWSAVRGHKIDSAKWLIEHNIGLGEEPSLQSIFDADDVEAYLLWVKASPHGRVIAEKLLYDFRPPPKIFEHEFQAHMIPYLHHDKVSPSLLFVLAEQGNDIKNVSEKIKTVIDAGISPNLINQDQRLSALDFAQRHPWKEETIASKALQRAGAKTGAEAWKAGGRAEIIEDDFSPEALKEFDKAAK